MKFYHRTTEGNWKLIQEEGYLWGIPGWGNLHERFVDRENRVRYTYLSPYDWGESYGTVLLEVEYEPEREDASVCVGGTIKNNEKSIKHNYGFDPPPGQRCVQFSVFEPIYLEKVKRIEVAA